MADPGTMCTEWGRLFSIGNKSITVSMMFLSCVGELAPRLSRPALHTLPLARYGSPPFLHGGIVHDIIYA